MDFIDIVMSIISAVIICIVLPLAKASRSSKKLENAKTWARVIVSAAEIIFSGEGRGEEKKEYAVKALKEHNIKYSDNEMDELIESAVYDITRH